MTPLDWTRAKHPKWCEKKHGVEFVSSRFRPITHRFFDTWNGTRKFRGRKQLILVDELFDFFEAEERNYTDEPTNHEALIEAGRKGAAVTHAKRRGEAA